MKILQPPEALTQSTLGTFQYLAAEESVSADDVNIKYFNAVYVITGGDVTLTSLKGDGLTSVDLPADRLIYGKFSSVASDSGGSAVLLAYHQGE